MRHGIGTSSVMIVLAINFIMAVTLGWHVESFINEMTYVLRAESIPRIVVNMRALADMLERVWQNIKNQS